MEVITFLLEHRNPIIAGITIYILLRAYNNFQYSLPKQHKFVEKAYRLGYENSDQYFNSVGFKTITKDNKEYMSRNLEELRLIIFNNESGIYYTASMKLELRKILNIIETKENLSKKDLKSATKHLKLFSTKYWNASNYYRKKNSIPAMDINYRELYGMYPKSVTRMKIKYNLFVFSIAAMLYVYLMFFLDVLKALL